MESNSFPLACFETPCGPSARTESVNQFFRPKNNYQVCVNIKIVALLIVHTFSVVLAQEKFLKVDFNSRYCFINNQKMMILNACRTAMQDNLILIEPFLSSIMYPQGRLFFDVFDFDYFVEKTKKYFKVVRCSQVLNPDVIAKGSILFDSEILLDEKKMLEHIPYIDDIEVAFYTGLRLNERYNEIVDELEKKIGQSYVAIHLRIEDDWPRDTQPYDCGVLYMSKERVLEKFINSECAHYKNIFLATAYNQDDLLDLWHKHGYLTYTHGKSLDYLDYLELSVIDFEMCLRAKIFIGNNESSFSNLVTHTRYLLGKRNSYSYNSKDDFIYPRTDYGLNLRRNVCKFANIKHYPHSPFCHMYGT